MVEGCGYIFVRMYVYVFIYVYLADGLDEREVVDAGGLHEGEPGAVHDGDGADAVAGVHLQCFMGD